jgi:uncharacterized protein YdeI (YjbR/CyaY-like superfamily)
MLQDMKMATERRQDTNPQVDAFIRKSKKWQQEMKALRTIVLGCGLTEEFKWRLPCYTLEKHAVVLISGLKEYCALAFYKGTLLKDTHRILVAPGPNSQAVRQIRFTSEREIAEMEPILKDYLQEAVAVERAGLNVKKNPQIVIPEELKKKWKEMPELKAAFAALTPGRQRGYALYFSAAKQSQTRVARIEKYSRRILSGKGMYD